MVRVMFRGFLLEGFLNFGNCTFEADIRRVMGRRFGRHRWQGIHDEHTVR